MPVKPNERESEYSTRQSERIAGMRSDGKGGRKEIRAAAVLCGGARRRRRLKKALVKKIK